MFTWYSSTTEKVYSCLAITWSQFLHTSGNDTNCETIIAEKFYADDLLQARTSSVLTSWPGPHSRFTDLQSLLEEPFTCGSQWWLLLLFSSLVQSGPLRVLNRDLSIYIYSLIMLVMRRQELRLTVICDDLLSILLLCGGVVDQHEVPVLALGAAQVVHQVGPALQTRVALQSTTSPASHTGLAKPDFKALREVLQAERKLDRLATAS